MSYPHKTRKLHVNTSGYFRQILSVFVLSLFSTAVYAQLASWNPASLSNFGPSPWAATTANANLTVTGLTRGSGITLNPAAAGAAWGGNSWGGNANQDATFTITANSGYQVSFSTFNWFYRRSGTGPATGTLYYAIGSGAYVSIAALAFSSSSSSGAALPAVSLSGIPALQNVPAGTVVKFRILPTGGASTGNLYVFGSGLSLNGAVAVAAPSCTSVTPGTINSSIANPSCAPASGILSLTGVTASGVTYQWRSSTDSLTWTNVGSNNDSLNTGSITTTTFYKAIVSCISGSVKDSTSVYKLVVNPVLTPSVTILASTSDTICSGTPVTFTATPVNGGLAPAYQWQKNGVNTGINSATYVDNSLANNDVVSVIMTSNAACTITPTDTSNAIVMTVNPVLVPSVTISVSPDDTVCAGTMVTFTATPTNGGSTPSYQWQKNGVNTGINSAAYTDNTLANSDVVSVIMTGNAICASKPTDTSNAIIMTVNPILIPSVIASVGPDDTICAGTMVTFTATPTNGGPAPVYQWKKGASVVGTNSPSYTDNTLINNDVVTVAMISNATCASTVPVAATSITMTVNPMLTPIVNITVSPDDTICIGTSVTFTATPNNGGTIPAYQWRKNGINIGTNSTTYTDNLLANNDIISVILTSNAICTTQPVDTSNFITMKVNPILTPSVTTSVSPNDTICVGTLVTFTAIPVNGGTSPVYEWRKGTNVVGTNSPTYTDNTLVSGDVVTVRITSNAACASVSTATSTGIAMTVNPVLNASVTASVSPNDTICAGTLVTFTATPVNGGTNPIYQWKKGTTTVGSNSPTYTDNTLANGNVVTVTMTSNAACANTTPVTSTGITMIVNPVVTPTLNITANPGTTICAGMPVTFTAAATNTGTAPVYQWRIGTTVVGTNSTTYTNNALANGDVVTASMTGNAVCAGVGAVTSPGLTMTVNSIVSPSVTINANPGNIVCVGTSVAFNAVTTNAGTTPVYQWRRNNTTVGTANTYTTNSLSNNDTIVCVLGSSLSCVSNALDTSNAIIMSVNTNAAPIITIIANPGTTVTGGTLVTFSANIVNGGSAATYEWKKNNVVVGTNSTYVTNTLKDNDTITCVVTVNNTCATTNTGASNKLIMKVSVGIGQVAGSGNDIILYPNPNNGTFTVQGTIAGDKNAVLEVLTGVGQLVYQKTIAVQNGKLSEAVSLPSDVHANGMYLLRVRSSSGVDVFRFVMSR